MSTFNHLELEYLIAAVSSKFSSEREHQRLLLEGFGGRVSANGLDRVETEVIRVIREWAAAEQPAGSGSNEHQ